MNVSLLTSRRTLVIQPQVRKVDRKVDLAIPLKLPSRLQDSYSILGT